MSKKRNVVRTTAANRRAAQPEYVMARRPRNCTDAVELFEERYGRHVMSRAQDRISAILMARLSSDIVRESEAKHMLRAFQQGETIFSEEWNLARFL